MISCYVDTQYRPRGVAKTNSHNGLPKVSNGRMNVRHWSWGAVPYAEESYMHVHAIIAITTLPIISKLLVMHHSNPSIYYTIPLGTC